MVHPEHFRFTLIVDSLFHVHGYNIWRPCGCGGVADGGPFEAGTFPIVVVLRLPNDLSTEALAKLGS